MKTTFEDKVVVITGSTQGLGAAVAKQIAECGATGLVITGRNQERGVEMVDHLIRLGARAVFVGADLADPATPRRIIATAEETFGRIDVLINSAGITDRDTILNSTPDLFDRMITVNTKAPWFLMQGAAEIMIREKIEGTMVNVLSISSHAGQPYIATYCASKAALGVYTKNTANALLKHRIRVNGLNPGWMSTPAEDRVQREYHGAHDGWQTEAGAHLPFGRLIDPEDAARAVLFLASSESGFMTGAIVDYDQQVIGAND